VFWAYVDQLRDSLDSHSLISVVHAVQLPWWQLGRMGVGSWASHCLTISDLGAQKRAIEI